MIREALTLALLLAATSAAPAHAAGVEATGESSSAAAPAVAGQASAQKAPAQDQPGQAAPSPPEPSPGAPKQPPPDDTSLEAYRTPLDTLTERSIGTASRAVRFDWRRSTLQIALMGSQLLEFNNFNSGRVGLLLRKPISGWMTELGVAWAFTGSSVSSDKLALTPYRQVGRPSRLEIDLNVGYPLAEGVVTPRASFFPATELVFALDAGLRYLYYPGELSGASFGEAAKLALAPSFSKLELDNLEGRRLPGMQVDRSRYNLLLGFSLDMYFGSGGFLSPRVMVAPSFTGASDSRLGWWWELTLGAGWAF